MVSPFIRQQIDPLNLEIAEAERLIEIQDDLTIAGLCIGIDTTEAEGKGVKMRRVLQGMKLRRNKLAGTS
jgi:hypothetical protein